MTLGEAVGLSDRQERWLVRALQAALAALLAYGVVTRQVGVAANGAFALALTLLPALLRREYGYTMDAGLTLWITTAIFLHTAGSLGLYEALSWFDSVTHTLSATVVAAVGYASFRAVELHSDDVDVPSEFRVLFVVVFVLAAGIVWEILEFATAELARALGTVPPLRVLGVDDIVNDLVFDAVGGLLVAVAGTDAAADLVEFLRRRLGDSASQ